MSRTHEPKPAAEGAGEPSRVDRPSGGNGRDRFGELLGEHRRGLLVVARAWLGRVDGADDVVQEAAILAMERFDGYREGTSFFSWMSAFVRNAARNARAARSRRRGGALISVLRNAARPEATPPEAPVHIDGAETGGQSWIERRIETLDSTQRECLLLRAIRGMSYAEIAASLGIAEATARSHVHRARRTLAEQREPDGPVRVSTGARATLGTVS